MCGGNENHKKPTKAPKPKMLLIHRGRCLWETISVSIYQHRETWFTTLNRNIHTYTEKRAIFSIIFNWLFGEECLFGSAMHVVNGLCGHFIWSWCFFLWILLVHSECETRATNISSRSSSGSINKNQHARKQAGRYRVYKVNRKLYGPNEHEHEHEK